MPTNLKLYLIKIVNIDMLCSLDDKILNIILDLDGAIVVMI